MEEQKFTVSQAAIKNGLIAGLISVIITTVSNMFALYENSAAGIVLIVVSVGISVYFIIASHNLFKANNGGFMTYGQGLGIGVIYALVSSAIGAVYSGLYIMLVDDGSVQFQKQQVEEQWAEQGLNQAQIEQAREIFEMFSGPVATIVLGILAGVFFGFILSLIISAVTKKTDPSLEI